MDLDDIERVRIDRRKDSEKDKMLSEKESAVLVATLTKDQLSMCGNLGRLLKIKYLDEDEIVEVTILRDLEKYSFSGDKESNGVKLISLASPIGQAFFTEKKGTIKEVNGAKVELIYRAEYTEKTLEESKKRLEIMIRQMR